MKSYLIDTDILSLFLRNHLIVVENFKRYFSGSIKPQISIFTYYEILSGLKYRDSKNLLDKFVELTQLLKIVNISMKSAEISANIYADLRAKGITIDEVDIFISGICIAENLTLITNNEKHYQNVKGLFIENWSKS